MKRMAMGMFNEENVAMAAGKGMIGCHDKGIGDIEN